MRRILLRCFVVVGALTPCMGLYQASLAQGSREPSVDERYRNEAQRSVDDPLQLSRRSNTKPANESEKPTEKPAAPFLGVIFGTDNRGATVRKVSPASPAEQAGLQAGDVIESLQGKRVRSYADVLNILRKMKPGEVIDIEYSRRMSLRTQAALGSEPGATQRTVGYPPDEASDGSKESRGGGNQVDRAAPHGQRGASAGQRRDDDSNSGESDESRQYRGRGFRRR